MSTPGSWARIEFPASLVDDEIRETLAWKYEAEFSTNGTVQDSSITDMEVEAGIFSIEDGEAPYGEFDELEDLLVKKGVPFDRESGMDWNAPPAIRIYRPGPPAFDHTDSTPDSYDEVVSVSKIREILKGKPADGKEVGLIAYKKIIDLMTYLDEAFPPYPPLTDFVKEESTP